MFFRLTKIELQKIIARPRSYIGFVAITVIIMLIHFAMYMDGKNYISFVIANVEQNFLFEGNVLNGNLITFIILQTLIIQIPLLIALVTGDMISGEAAMGTLRLLATKPISRTDLLLSKFTAGSIYTIAMLVWLGLLSLGLGLLIFGPGDLIVLKTDEMIILQSPDVLWRFLTALVLAFLALSLVGALSLMLSCFTDNSIGPIIITMAIIILFTIIGTMEVPVFDSIKPLLFTSHMVVWRNLFESPLPIKQIYTSIGVLIGHVVVFLGIAIYYFNRKDILS